MKKITSVVLMLLVFCSNFFYYSFANEKIEVLEELNGSEKESLKEDNLLPFDNELQTLPKTENFDTKNENVHETLRWQAEIDTENDEAQRLDEYNSKDGVENNSKQSSYSCSECNDCEDGDYDESLDELCDFCISCYDDEWTWEDNTNYENLPNLIISEVFFGWTNEWIEIYNSWENFGGNLEFSWAAKWIRTVSNIFIPAWNTVIIWNNWANNVVSWIPVSGLDSSSFSIADDKEFQIKLMFSWAILDTFQALASKKKNTISFQRFIDTQNIVETTSGFVQNVNEWFIANPWIVYNEPETWDEPDEPENSELTWDTEATPNLKITEIYFDWDDNRFEITNLWNNIFSWDLTLNWNLNFTISTQIPVWISKVFANNLAMFENPENIEIIPNNISFNNEQINLNLIRSWEILDTFFVHESRVNYLQEYETSFEKVWYWNNRTTTYVWLNLDRIYNTNLWISANPTKYFTQWENMKDVTKDRNWTEIYTGDNYTLPVNCNDLNEYMATISEVYFWNDVYPSYVELRIDNALSDYSKIMLSWSAISSPV